MSARSEQISAVRVTPVAMKDPPLLNSNGMHEPFALRAIIECETGDGLIGLGETYGELKHFARLRSAAEMLIGLDPFSVHELHRRVAVALGEQLAHAEVRTSHYSRAVEETFAAFEVACFDLQGKRIGRPVSDLLGGAVRAAVPYSAYLFYRYGEHPIAPGYGPDDWGEALDPEGIVAQASRMVERYGFSALKLKGGVFPPDEEIEAVIALAEAFSEHKVRIDPNAAWGVETSIRVAKALEGHLEYLEDPTPTIAGMAQVAAVAAMPLATNMCVVELEHVPPAVAANAVQIILSDHHFWGGLSGSRRLAGLCETFSIGLSMHSNSHLGISLAAMTHLAAATPNLNYACDTHTPWLQGEDVVKERLVFKNGAITVPTAPGLGVTLDRDALGELAEQYASCSVRRRDDTGYRQRFDPSYEPKRPRW